MGQNDQRGIGYGISLGLEVAVGVGLGLIVGNWLDRKFAWAPWGMLIGSMLGLSAGLYLVIKQAIQMNKDE